MVPVKRKTTRSKSLSVPRTVKKRAGPRLSPGASIPKQSKQSRKERKTGAIQQNRISETIKLKTGIVRGTVVDSEGKAKGTMQLPKELFAAHVNVPLMAQSVRVYQANQRGGSASTKTRGEVDGSTRKIYRQKGTGKARHGAIRAPIFVGGGIVFGPKPRDYRMNLSKSMKRLAFASALTSKFQDGDVIIVDTLNNVKPKTKYMAESIHALAKDAKVLVVVSDMDESAVRFARNISHVDITPAYSLNTYSVISHDKLLVTKDSIEVLTKTFTS
jgi:large subunit ribosomal protein L4